MKERHFQQSCFLAVLILSRKNFRRLIIRIYKLNFLYFVRILTRIKVHMIDFRASSHSFKETTEISDNKEMTTLHNLLICGIYL